LVDESVGGGGGGGIAIEVSNESEVSAVEEEDDFFTDFLLLPSSETFEFSFAFLVFVIVFGPADTLIACCEVIL
jgi:hypothetical protein